MVYHTAKNVYKKSIPLQLQDAIDLDMQEDGDADKLKKWRKYRVLLSRVDTSAENMELPTKPD